MQTVDRCACVPPEVSLREVVISMSKYPLGGACIVDDEHRLVGLITDGDLRRALQRHDDIRGLSADVVMTRAPITILPAATLREAVELMENRPSQISILPVVDEEWICQGLLRLHDIYRSDAP
jgi:arabinose-5-phosphate isomerase